MILTFPKPIVPRASNFTQRDRAACWRDAARKFAADFNAAVMSGKYATAELLAEQAIRCMHRAVDAEGEQT